jgi:ferrous-iron efflux pump FieF
MELFMDIKQRASLFAVASACLLAAAKFCVGLVSGSMTVVSSGLDSLMDVFMSAMNLFAIKKAAKPADHDHQYGHGKVEDLAAIVQSLVIIFTGGMIIHKSVHSYLYHGRITYSGYDLAVMGLSLLFSLAISMVLKRIGDRTGSNALKADALHYTSDLYSNSGAILAIILTYYTGKSLYDLSFAVVVGAIIIVSAFKILRTGFAGLMDRSIPAEVEEEIQAILRELPYPYAGFHKMRTRLAGSRRYVDFHLLICKKLTIDDAHEVADKIQKRIEESVARLDIIIHVEPCRYECDMTDETCTVLKMRIARRNSPDG